MSFLRFKGLLSLAGMFVAVLAVASVAHASPPFETETWFYSDDTLTTEVGYRLVPCTGSIHREGEMSSYSVHYRGESCSGGIGNNCVACYGFNDIGEKDQLACPLHVLMYFGVSEC